MNDIPSNRSLFQLAVSERHINGIGYGSLLPTVQTQGLKVCDKDGKTRFMDLSSLPKQGIKYGDLLPTPVASDHTGSCTIRKMTKSNGAPRTDSLRNMPAVIGMDGDRLNGRVFQLSIWMWMILCINIITDNENKKDRMIIAYPSIIM